jgi:hypothetical protein
MKMCHACKKEIPADSAIGRREACPSCSADLRCCLNCQFYDSAASKQCREPVAELVREKAKANFCDYFIFMEGRTDARDDSRSQTRKALDDLFRK